MRVIGGSKRGTNIKALDGADTRPTLDRVRENIFNIIQGQVQDAAVLDLFAGSGALGCEAISRGAASVLFNDSSREAIAVVKENTEKLGFEKQAKLWQLDWKTALKKLLHDGTKFDIVLLDAPYHNDYMKECVQECHNLLKEDGIIVVEHDENTVFDGAVPRKYGKVRVSILGK